MIGLCMGLLKRGQTPFFLDIFKKGGILLFFTRFSMKAVGIRIVSKKQAEKRRNRKNRKKL